jgi:hypothetical protein
VSSKLRSQARSRALPGLFAARGAWRRTSPPRRSQFRLEELEPRCLLSGGLTLDHSQNLQTLNIGGQLGATGTISGAGVDFYSFTVGPQAVQVHLQTQDVTQGTHLSGVLSLYNTDPLDPLGHRLIAQDDGAATQGYAALDETLAANTTYYVAVSGSGNDYFNPFLPGSGYAASTGDYALQITATDAGIQPGDGPAVLSVDPANNAVLSASPLVLRVDLSDSIDQYTLQPDVNVVLNYSPTSDFSNPTQITGLSVNYDDVPGGVKEIQVTPPAPLGPGDYQLLLQGNEGDQQQFLSTAILDASDYNPLGENGNNPNGQNYTFTFQVAGSEGTLGSVASADDTTATAHQLGTLNGAGLVQVAGAIGDDPTDPAGFDPNDVDLYHFQVTGSGNYAFAAELFAGRIGSTLEPAVSLFRAQPDASAPSGVYLNFVASNRGTGDAVVASDGSQPLVTDPALFASLPAGDYYLAVSSGRNVPDATHPMGLNYQIFDLNASPVALGTLGNSTGPYVLNLELEAAPAPTDVVATSLTEGEVLAAPPTTLTTTFDGPVDLQQLAFGSPLQPGTSEVAPVFIVDAGGNKIYPRFQSFDPTTDQATFSMLDALPNGSYTLHLSGPDGLTDLAGNAIVGNDPSGDYVVHFTVAGPQRGTPGDPTAWVSQEPNDGLADPQILGLLFPDELANTVTVRRPGGPASDTADYYQFTLLQTHDYFFSLPQVTGSAATLSLWSGNTPVTLAPQMDGSFEAHLQPGTYVVGVSWSGSGSETYQLDMVSRGSPETATPLLSGPTPALALRLVRTAPLPSTDTEGGLTTVASPLPVPVPGIASTAAASAAAEAAAAEATPAAPGNLFLALSEGPLGGVRGNGSASSGTEAMQTAQAGSFVLPGLAALVLTPQVLFGGDNADAPADGTFPGLVGGAGPQTGTIRDFRAIDFAWRLGPEVPLAVAEAVVRGGVGVVGAFGPWSVAGSSPAPEVAAGQAPAAETVHTRADTERPGADAAGAPSQPDAAATRLLRSAAAVAVIGLVWGFLSGKRWWGSRSRHLGLPTSALRLPTSGEGA